MLFRSDVRHAVPQGDDGGIQFFGDVGQLVPTGVVVVDGEVSCAQTFGGVLDAAYAAGQTAVDEQDDEADDDEGHGGDDDKKEREVVDAGPYLQSIENIIFLNLIIKLSIKNWTFSGYLLV